MKRFFQSYHVVMMVGCICFGIGMLMTFRELCMSLKDVYDGKITYIYIHELTFWEIKYGVLTIVGLVLCFVDAPLFGYDGVWPDPEVQKEMEQEKEGRHG